MDYLIRIANIIISIHSIYDIVNNNINKYKIESAENPDIEVVSNNSLVKTEFERLCNLNNDIASFSSVEALMIQRTIAERLPMYNTFLMHGAAIAVEGEAYIFSAKSGTGKTTHINHWLENNKKAYVVNGDKPYIQIDGKSVFACGTPWCGKEDMGENTMVPVRSIVFMERSNENKMEKVPFKSILPRLLEQTYHPSDVAQMRLTLQLLLKLQDLVSFYIFHFNNFKEDVFSVSYNTLTKR